MAREDYQASVHRGRSNGAALLAAAVSALILVGVSGCSFDDPGAASFATYDPQGDSMDAGAGALIEGRLVMTDGCVLVVDHSGDQRLLPVFPKGSTWDSKEQTLTMPDGSEFEIDTQVRLGGGHGSPESVAYVPEACPAIVEVFIVNYTQ